jgi:hypothetical protein
VKIPQKFDLQAALKKNVGEITQSQRSEGYRIFEKFMKQEGSFSRSRIESEDKISDAKSELLQS